MDTLLSALGSCFRERRGFPERPRPATSRAPMPPKSATAWGAAVAGRRDGPSAHPRGWSGSPAASSTKRRWRRPVRPRPPVWRSDFLHRVAGDGRGLRRLVKRLLPQLGRLIQGMLTHLGRLIHCRLLRCVRFVAVWVHGSAPAQVVEAERRPCACVPNTGEVTPLRRARYRRDRARRGSSELLAVLSSTTSAAGWSWAPARRAAWAEAGAGASTRCNRAMHRCRSRSGRAFRTARCARPSAKVQVADELHRRLRTSFGSRICARADRPTSRLAAALPICNRRIGTGASS